VNDTGCGHALALDRPLPLRLAMDAMRHWVGQAGLAGLRLDLATTLGRRADGFDPDAPLLQAVRQDPLLRDRWIIAEPWDVGHHGHRLGAFAPGWGEWNDRFRDGIRRFWRGDAGSLGEAATRMAGSRDVFGTRPATDSINFVTAHDGFTLADLVSHAHKHNLANGEDNRDGTNDNLSWNHGVEGATDDDAILARRRADMRALLATLLAARGTPMLSMGDEAGRSQGGNNNAWCQDNATSWFDWAGADQALINFTARLVAARRASPALSGAAPLTGEADATGEPDVLWLRLNGTPMAQPDWTDPAARSVAMLLHHDSARALVALHGGDTETTLHLPAGNWRWLAASDDPSREGAAEATVTLAPRSVAWFAEIHRAPRPAESPGQALIAQLAEAAGVATSWYDISGTRNLCRRGRLRAVLAAPGCLPKPPRRRVTAWRAAAPRHDARRPMPANATTHRTAAASASRRRPSRCAMTPTRASATSPRSRCWRGAPPRAARRWSASARRMR
jgi:glycogen debranching enzyme GlgX